MKFSTEQFINYDFGKSIEIRQRPRRKTKYTKQLDLIDEINKSEAEQRLLRQKISELKMGIDSLRDLVIKEVVRDRGVRLIQSWSAGVHLFRK